MGNRYLNDMIWSTGYKSGPVTLEGLALKMLKDVSEKLRKDQDRKKSRQKKEPKS